MRATELLQALAAHGYQARLVAIARAAELEARFGTQDGLTPGFAAELQGYYNFDWQQALPEAKSIVVLAKAQMPTRVSFAGRPVLIPPTYISRPIWEGSLALMNELLTPQGHHVARARLPLKLLAVRSGLAAYGRNNISYVAGLGSFYRLGGFYTDVGPDGETWQEPRLLARCEKCTACLKHCPTGAIRADRVLIEAQRCLTYMNEREEDFPAWVAPAWHNALIGCMTCQQACPENRPFAARTEEAALNFSKDETALILARTPLAALPEEARRKLHELCLDDDYAVVARNLGFLVRR